MTPERRANLDRLLAPRHIAFVGGRDAEIAIQEAERAGFRGQIWAINPRRESLGGYPCVSDLADLPEAPDAAYLAVPAAAAVEATATLAGMGAGGIVCYSAGFRESGEVGAELERRLVEAAGDLALVGPNCYGVINYLDRVALWPFAHGGSTPGWGAAIITQSGMLSSDLTMSQRSVPLTHMVSGGNQAVLSIEDFIDHLAGHPAVRAIGLHIEGLRDARKFERACLKAAELSVPVVALKTGSSRIAASLAVSHTGSLSGDDDLHNALFERCAVVRVDSPAELLESLKFLCVSGAPRGRRVAGFTCSGGGAAMMADLAAKAGLAFPAYGVAAAEELADLLPAVATVSNPLDYTTPIWGQLERTLPVFDRAIEHAGADVAVLVQDYPASGLEESKPFYQADANAFVEVVSSYGLPAAICSTLPESLDAETRENLVGLGVSPLQGLPEAICAIQAGALWSERRNRILDGDLKPLFPAVQGEAARLLDEAEGKRRVAEMGIRVPEGRVVSGDGAPAAAADIGFPSVLKMLGPRLTHKTDAGAIAISLQSAAEVKQAVDTLRSNVETHDPLAVTDRFLVEAMETEPAAELLLTIRADSQFGLALTIGAGGVLAELVDDVVTLLLPAETKQIARALRSLKVSSLIAGYRGKPGADLEETAKQIAGFAKAAADHAGTIAEVEINPLFVSKHRLVAVDVLMHEWGST